MNQKELGNEFRRGATSGKASNVQIIEKDGKTQLVGYGHAVYAERENGHITVYTGWYGYSKSTSCQFTKMGLKEMADETVDEQKKV